MNRNIEKIILHLEDAHQKGTLCKVGQARLKWWKRHGKKFRTLKAALSTWTVAEIEAWFDYASIFHARAGRTEKARNSYWAVDNLSDHLEDPDILPKFIKVPAKRLFKQVRTWLEVEGKKNLLNKSEHQLLGSAFYVRIRK